MARKKPETKAVATREQEAIADDRKTELIVKMIPTGVLGFSVASNAIKGLVGDASDAAAIELMKQTMADVGPTSMIERMMMEQMVVIHAQVMNLNRIANRMEYLDQKEKAFGLAVKMQGEFRKTAAALKEWRAPTRQFIVAQQANVAHQQVVNQVSPEKAPIANEVGSKDG